MLIKASLDALYKLANQVTSLRPTCMLQLELRLVILVNMARLLSYEVRKGFVRDDVDSAGREEPRAVLEIVMHMQLVVVNH